MAIEPHFARKGSSDPLQITILPRFLADRTSFRSKALRPDARNFAVYQVLAIEPRFVRKGCARTREIAVLLQFLVGTAPRLQERNGKEGESKRAREQEGKRARGQESKRARENVKM